MNRSITLELKVGGVLQTGQASNITFRKNPYDSVADVISGITVTETGYGTYTASGFTTWYTDTQAYLSGTKIDSFGIKETGYIWTTFVNKLNATMQTLLSGLTLGGNLVLGGNKVTGSAAATANGDLPRWEQTGVITETRTISGQWLFSTHPSATPGGVTFPPTNSGHYTPKWYVDGLFGSAIGVVQSTYMNKLLPLRAINDAYSNATPELCYSYLSGLTDVATRTGVVLIEPSGVAGNVIDVDNHATNQWIGNGIFYVGVGSKPVINRKAYNSSLTFTGGFVNCRIKDGATGTPVVSSRTYVNATFRDCEFDVPDATDITFTGCKFLGVNKLKSVSGNAITLTNCTGDMFWYNDTVSATVSVSGTQPCDVRSVTSANLNW